MGEQNPSVSIENLAANDTGDFSVAGDTSGVSFSNDILTINGGSPTISMATEGASTSQRIEVADAASITLAGVNISATAGPALKIEDNAGFDVTITLQDGSENKLETTNSQSAGLQKNGDSGVGTLTIQGETAGSGKLTVIGGPAAAGIGAGSIFDNENSCNITITGGIIIAKSVDFTYGSGAGLGGAHRGAGKSITISGGIVTATGGESGAGIGGGSGSTKGGTDITISGGTVTATGGKSAAGIGGGSGGDGTDITISGGTVTATGGPARGEGTGGAGIGGGQSGSGNNNNLDGDNVVIKAESGGAAKDALEGFGTTINKGLIFRKGKETSNVWSGDMYTSATITGNFEIPYSLPIAATQKLTIGANATLTLASDATLTVEDGAELANEGTISDATEASITNNGKITTKANFYLKETDETPYTSQYQTYKEGTTVGKYINLPNPDTTTLAKTNVDTKAVLADESFEYWYYLNTSGAKVPINDTTDVLLNQHTFYEKTATVYNITISSLQNGSITSNKTQAAKDETVTLTVTPEEGYELSSGSLKVVAGSTEIALTDKGDGTYTFSMPEANVVVSATFEPVPGPGPEPGPGPDPTPTDTVTLTFRTDEGSWNGITETTLTGAPDAVIIPPSYPYTDASRTCIGWFDEQSNEVVSGVTTFEEVTGVVTARFVDTPGWHQNATGWWYVYDFSNNYYTNCWALINSAWFYFNDAGYCLEYTWGYINGAWYFFGWGGYMQTGWQYLNHTWYFLDRYTGEMKTGWQKDGVWYYLNPETGAMYNNCWAYINGNWYGFNEGGSMTQGWSWSYAYDGWFYLEPETGHMLYAWQYIGGHWYYFYDNGLMAANTRIGTYRLGADGAMW